MGESKANPKTQGPAARRWVVLGVVLLLWAGLLALGIALFAGGLLGNRGATRANGMEDPSMGPANAPVTVLEYGDFACPDCRAWYMGAIREQILLEYGGEVRFVWRNFPVASPESEKAAEGAHCAADQGKFWDYHNIVFMLSPQLTVADLRAYAKQAGLNASQFNQCLDSGKYGSVVAKEIADGQQRGFTGVPVFFINDVPLTGNATFEAFKSAIDQALADKGITR
jgi:protein-disulfide isomerase